jgi:5'-deoxynucleotidase YfbR-like HD superfamily hydrolase
MESHELVRTLGGVRCTRCNGLFPGVETADRKPCPESFDAAAAVLKATRLREASSVERCHGTPHHGSYSVGWHSYNAALLLLILHPTLQHELEQSPAGKLLLAVLFHDTHERWLGDLYGPAKWKYPELGEAHERAAEDVNRKLGLDFLNDLDAESTAWVKAVDRIELRQWALDQLAGGNQHASAIERRGAEELGRMALPPRAADFLDALSWVRTDEHLEDK